MNQVWRMSHLSRAKAWGLLYRREIHVLLSSKFLVLLRDSHQKNYRRRITSLTWTSSGALCHRPTDRTASRLQNALHGVSSRLSFSYRMSFSHSTSLQGPNVNGCQICHVRRQIYPRSGFSEIGCWDGISKTRQVQRDRVLGQELSQTPQVSEIGCWDGISKTRQVCDECRGRDARNSGIMRRVWGH
jgi:hypothetical protein